MYTKKLFFIYIVLPFNFLFSQEYSQKTFLTNVPYHEYITRISEPSYKLKKIKNMISGLQPLYLNSEEEKTAKEEYNVDYYLVLPEKEFKKLSSKEKFTYTMIHPELISQIYAEKNFIQDEENKISGYLALTMNGANWSDNQISFLKSERKEVIKWIKEYSQEDRHIGLNYKKALEEINAVESIPFLIDFYQNIDKRDKDILTLLLILVKKSRYYPFVRSNLYRNMYKNEDSTSSSYIDYSLESENYIIKIAENYYKASGIR